MTATATPPVAADPESAPPPLVAAGRRRRPGPADVVLLVIAAFFCVPLAWVVLASFDGEASLAVAWPSVPTLDNYAAVLDTETTFRPMWNSVVLCGGATVVTVVCAVLAAYPLSRYRSRASRPFLLTIVFATGLPITAIMIPVYALFVQVNLVDSMPAAVLFLATSALPYAIFLTKGFMDGVPVEIEEAAWTDGATMLRTLWEVVLPLMRPGVAVVAIFTLVQTWGNFFVPFMLLLSPDKLPAAVSLFTFSSQYGQVAYGQLAAFSILYSAPVVMLYLLLGRRLGSGFAAAGGLKT
ncbi:MULTISPECIES: carbohydrate ABC transporter permease [unclassified Pseudonocardia]|uniref:carbohydrate ABC transporter permease n=1 Tax=unclassified Pseudonocardia TaxID=2619320 RepID=UPI0001FFEC1B|nr:carbohydrate ABC transporter permease [Pseudonocardia sp. Ae707_Ps1]OLM20270.1 putative integral membrane transport protein [Pseudonocardia sp. Ae707_Ps1]